MFIHQVDVAFTSGTSDAPGGVPRTTRVTARRALVATGSRAVRLDTLDGLYGKKVAGAERCFDSDSIKVVIYRS